MLEYDYLSSAEKLTEYQMLYFDDELVKKNIQEIRIIRKKLNQFYFDTLKLVKD